MLGATPTILGATPTMLGTTPTMLGTTPTILGATPTMLSTTPTIRGTTPTMRGTTPTLLGAMTDVLRSVRTNRVEWASHAGSTLLHRALAGAGPHTRVLGVLGVLHRVQGVLRQGPGGSRVAGRAACQGAGGGADRGYPAIHAFCP